MASFVIISSPDRVKDFLLQESFGPLSKCFSLHKEFSHSQNKIEILLCYLDVIFNPVFSIGDKNRCLDYA